MQTMSVNFEKVQAQKMALEKCPGNEHLIGPDELFELLNVRDYLHEIIHRRDSEIKIRKDAECRLCEAAELLEQIAFAGPEDMAEKAKEWLKKNDPWRNE